MPADGRGAALDAGIDQLRADWSGTGAHRRYRQLPRPQPIPVWIGGSGPAARRRVVERGDAWFPMALSPEELAAGRADLPPSLGCASLLFATADDRATGAGWLARFFQVPTGVADRMLVGGSLAAVDEAVAAHRASGAHHVCVLLATDDPLPAFEQLRR